MPLDLPSSLEGHAYRLALWLCPPGFRREHGDEMSRDFDEARGEAAGHGRGRLWSLRLLMAIDLVRTLAVQWLRTGLPFLALALILIPLHVVAAAMLAGLARLATIAMPAGVAQAETMGVLLLAITVVMLIAITITLNLWVSRLNARRRR